MLKDFADIAEIGGVESFSETRVDAFQIGDGAGPGLRLGRETHPARGNPQTPRQSGLLFRQVHSGAEILFCTGTVAAPRAKLPADAKELRHFPAFALVSDGLDFSLYRVERIIQPLPDCQTFDQCDGGGSTIKFEAISNHPGQGLLKQFKPFVYRACCDLQLSLERERDIVEWCEAVLARMIGQSGSGLFQSVGIADPAVDPGRKTQSRAYIARSGFDPISIRPFATETA